jgi:hypothetical protein
MRVTGIQSRAVSEYGFPRPDPADRVGRHAGLQQPQARVDRGLADTDDREPAGRAVQRDQVVDRNQPDAWLDVKRRHMRGRD